HPGSRARRGVARRAPSRWRRLQRARSSRPAVSGRTLPCTLRLRCGRRRHRRDPGRRPRIRHQVDRAGRPRPLDPPGPRRGRGASSPARGRPGVVHAASAATPPPSIDREIDQLTPREREVLRFIARGYAYKEIARELHISVKTVESHVSAVLRKLQLSNRYELSRWATDRRLVYPAIGEQEGARRGLSHY